MNVFLTTMLSGLAGASTMQLLRNEEKTRRSFLNYFFATTALCATYSMNASPALKITHSVLTTISCYYDLYTSGKHESLYAALKNAPYAKIIAIALLQIPCVFLPLPIAIAANIAISYGAEYLDSKYQFFAKVSSQLPDLTKYLDNAVHWLAEEKVEKDSLLQKAIKTAFNIDISTEAGSKTYNQFVFAIIPSLSIMIFRMNGVTSAILSLGQSYASFACLFGYRFAINSLSTPKGGDESYPMLFMRTTLYTISDSALLLLGAGKSFVLTLGIYMTAIPCARNMIDGMLQPADSQKQVT